MKFKTENTSVNISFYFAAVLTLSLLLDKTNISFCSIVSALLHETGHMLCLFSLKAKPKEIKFGLFGMRIVRGNKTLSYKNELLTALSGPLVNIMLFAVFLYWKKTLVFSAVNLALGIFNLLPVKPMDGGEALYYFLCSYCEENKIKRITDITTFLTVIFLTVAGVFVLIKSGYNFMLLVVSVYIVFYRFIS